MPKATDITGSFRVPEEAWGRFWNTMLTIPGAEVTPNVRAAEKSSRRTNGSLAAGSTAKCIILAALQNQSSLTRKELEAFLEGAGKNPTAVGSALQDLRNGKHVKRVKNGWASTPLGTTFLKQNCTGKKKAE